MAVEQATPASQFFLMRQALPEKQTRKTAGVAILFYFVA
jgi:cytochrome c1